MAAEQLQIQVQANVQNAVSGLNNLNKSLEQTNKAAVSTGTAGMGNLTKGSNQATFALQNFGRVASDAPFGLIGIANNIDPLVQSFVQLRKETGSGKAALAALGSSLTGSGGLILGISLLTSALQFAQIGFDRWFAGSKKAKDAADKQKESKDALKSATDSIIQSYAKELVQVTKLVAVVKDSATSTDLRKESLKELNKIAPEYFKNLKDENDAINKLTGAYNKYVENIRTSIDIKIIEKQLEANLEKQLKFNKEYDKTLAISNGLVNITAKQATGINAQNQGVNLYNKALQQQRDLQSNLTADRTKLQIEEKSLINQLIALQQKLGKINADGLNLGNQGSQKSIDLLKEYNLALKAISWNEVNRGIDGTIERLNLAESTLQSFLKQGVEPTRKEFVFITQEVEKFRAAYARVLALGRIELSIPKIQDKEVNKFAEGLKKLDTFKDAPGFVLESLSKGLIKANEGAAKLGETFKAAEILRKNSEKNLKELTATIEGFVNPVIDNLFSALEQGEDPFKALIQSVKQLVFELGKAIVKSLVLKAIQTALAPQTSALPLAGFQPGNIRFDQLRFAFFR
jgi:hypothetical protein